MTTLQTRPSPPSSPVAPTAGSATGRDGRRTDGTRPLAVSAALAGVGVALAGLVVLQAVALTGWFLADGGAHGSTRDALRVGADTWLVGHGSHLTYAGVDYTVVPLGVSLLLAWAAYRAGRWAGVASPVSEDRELRWAGVLFAAGYVVVAVGTAVLAGTSTASGNLVLTVLGALVLGGGSGTAGMLSGADRWYVVGDRLPVWVAPVLRGALTVLGGLLVVAAALVVTSFVLHLGAASAVLSRLGLNTGDAVMLTLLSLVLAPNAVLMGSAYLVGPGFAVGTGTSISPTVVALGPMPAFPLLAALPGDGATPWFAPSALAVPPLVAALAVAWAQRRQPVRAWDVAAVRGLGAGVLAGVLTAGLVALAGGALGDGRMADVGAPVAQVLVVGCGSMGLGGLLGALVATFFQRRHPVEETPVPVRVAAAREPVVLVPARPDEVTVRLTPGEPDESPAAAEVVEPDVVQGEVTGSTTAPGPDPGDLLARFLEQSAQQSASPHSTAPDTGPDAEDTVEVRSD